ncbi:hypothetical protein ASPZODRAFT_300276 [Penicilliopsis zonata CBS 506.65]|uniref:Transmembrane protein n=1 Tax=Penicilliopsis zonata CBS 506.65 TaxID=1073090 RepID=A0A1L9SUR8_9EURO|nr:hypothetical protein ASPZODRAFT_300276 [Penicilliopsis zonata CBS 506.65]OJJ50970.1 hypothetical protein ASPZODRAFT_300276 [Penicilliopsis zonata CBS 506.65]
MASLDTGGLSIPNPRYLLYATSIYLAFPQSPFFFMSFFLCLVAARFPRCCISRRLRFICHLRNYLHFVSYLSVFFLNPISLWNCPLDSCLLAPHEFPLSLFLLRLSIFYFF